MFRLFGNRNSYHEDKVDSSFISIIMNEIGDFVSFCNTHKAVGVFSLNYGTTVDYGIGSVKWTCRLFEIDGINASEKFRDISKRCERIKSQTTPSDSVGAAYYYFSEYFGGYKSYLFENVTEHGYDIDGDAVEISGHSTIYKSKTWKDTKLALAEKLQNEFQNVSIKTIGDSIMITHY